MHKLPVTFLRIFSALLAVVLAGCSAPLADVPLTGAVPAQADPAAPGRAVLVQFSGGENSDSILLLDLQTGEPVSGLDPVTIGTQVNYALSPDGSHLAVASKGAGCTGMCVRLFDLRTLQFSILAELPEMKYTTDSVGQIVFAPGGRRLAFTYVENGQGRLALVDLITRGKPSLRAVDFPYTPNLMAFTANGDGIMMAAHPYGETLYASPGIQPNFYAMRVDAPQLQVAWTYELSEVKDGFFGTLDHANLENSTIYQPALVFDTARERLYIAHADADRLTTIDFGRRQVSTIEIREPQGWLEGLVERVLSLGVRPVQAKAGNSFIRQGLLSPDRRVLYLVGQRSTMTKTSENEYDTSFATLGLEAWEVDSGLRQMRRDSEAVEIRPGAGGEILLGGYDRNAPVYKPFTQVFDPLDGKISAKMDDTFVYTTLNTGGQAALVSSYSNDSGSTYLSFYPIGLLSGKPLWQRILEDTYAFFPEVR